MKILLCKVCSFLASLLLVSSFVGCGRPASEPAKPSPSPQSSNGIGTNPPPSHPAPATGATREQGDTSSDEFEGTTAKTENQRLQLPPVELREIRTGQHPTFDRVVFEFKGASVPGYNIEYIPKPVSNCAGEGEPVLLEGNARLQIVIMPARAHTEAGEATVKDLARKPNFTVLKEMKSTCDYEADVTWVLGLSAANPYRVLELSNPARLVIDIKRRG